MERDIIYWVFETNDKSLYDWLDEHKNDIVSYSVTRYEKTGRNIIATSVMAIIEK